MAKAKSRTEVNRHPERGVYDRGAIDEILDEALICHVGFVDEGHPFVEHEQMMPFVPVVRVPDVDTAIALAKKWEHGFRHTAIIHSRNVETITRMGREMDVTLFVQNGPSMAALGLGGEGYLSFSIATPTGEGVTTPLTFTRQRRSTTVGSMRVL